jgi:purine-binding chemotaxis protein CheW
MSEAGPGLYCTFRVGDALFGVDILLVKEVTTQTAFTPVPHAPAVVCGYVNLRGQLHLVLDARRLLGLGDAPPPPEARLILFKPAAGEAFGVLVDGVGDVVAVEPARVEAWQPEDAADGGARASGMVRGAAKLDGDLVVLVDPRKFLDAVDRARAEGVTT